MAHFHRGRATLKVPMALHAQNRARLVAKCKKAPGFTNGKGVVVAEGGKTPMRHDTDHEDIFRQESYFHWLFGVLEPDFFGAINLDSGRSLLFIPKLPAEYAIWMGTIHSPEHFRKAYEVDEVHYVDEIADVLLKQENASVLYTIKGLNTDSREVHKPAQFPGMEAFKVDHDSLFPVISQLRVIKTPAEIELMRYVCKVTSDAHKAVMRAARPGMFEYELESLFMHHSYSQGGCRLTSYTCIAATGPNSATLHYGHAGAPNDRQLRDGDMALMDLGAEYHCYGGDITCSFPVNGRFTQDQRDVYECVLYAQQAVLTAMKPGVRWLDMHILALRTLLGEMTKRGFLQGSVDEMMAAHLGAVFMPHGLGHLLGIDTHDVGGYPDFSEKPTQPDLKPLRTVRPLEEGMVITVEPGLYFIEHTLNKAKADPALSKFIVWERVDRLRGTGGVRLEDDVLVTASGAENLTHCPRTVAEVEQWMAGGREASEIVG